MNEAVVGSGAMSPLARRVLLVEDDPSFRGVIEVALSHAGFAVSAAENGEVALSFARSNPPDIVVLDSHLPVLDGLGFVRAYRAATDKLPPLVAITGRHDPALFASLIGAAAYLRKPFSPDELVATVHRVLGTAA